MVRCAHAANDSGGGGAAAHAASDASSRRRAVPVREVCDVERARRRALVLVHRVEGQLCGVHPGADAGQRAQFAELLGGELGLGG
ncbi:hypothetical protein, partial [Streptomyces sp. WAC07061]|uniref:hypothetical protein n=1 Tax=Streptomyces sp. WAC07061 TaxID=2487410 RepID=UPI0021B01DAB